MSDAGAAMTLFNIDYRRLYLWQINILSLKEIIGLQEKFLKQN